MAAWHIFEYKKEKKMVHGWMRHGVDFIKVGRTAQIIKIALSFCLDSRYAPTPYFYACKKLLKSWALHFAPCTQFCEINPWCSGQSLLLWRTQVQIPTQTWMCI